MLAPLRKPHILLLTILVWVAIGIMARLGVWQLDRLKEKVDLNVSRAILRSAPPAILPAVPEGDLLERAALAEGRFLPEKPFKILNRGFKGAPGIDLVSVFELQNGELLLVDRGYAPLHLRPDPPAPPEGPQRLTGYLFVPRYDNREAHPGTLPLDEWVRIDPAEMRAATGRPFLPYALVMTDSVESGLWPKAKKLPPIDEGPHLSYALQWFSFAGIFLFGWIAILWRATRKQP